MLKIQYDETPGVGFLARQSDTISASTASNVRVVNTDISRSISLADQALTLSHTFIDIVDVPIRWVVTLCFIRRIPKHV